MWRNENMKKAIMAIVLLLVLIVGIVGVSAASMKVAANKNTANKAVLKEAITAEEKAELKAETPDSYEKVEKEIEKVVIPRRFLMYTNDGKNIMWGTMGRGYFIGEDNLGNKAWGIYHGGTFAGFYDGNDFFVGKYNRGRWKAENLFNRNYSAGKYVLFPFLTAASISAQPIE